jgi:sporulation related protein
MNPVEEDRALEEEPGGYSRREQRGREAMDPATRHLAFIAGGLGLLLAVLIGGWLLGGHHSGAIPVIEPVAGPVRVKPVDPGGMQAMGAQAPPMVSGTGTETLAPRPESARPDALQAEVDAARRAGSAEQKPPAAASAPPITAAPGTPTPGTPGVGSPGAGAPSSGAPAPGAPSTSAGETPQPAPLPVPHSPGAAKSSPLLRTEAEPGGDGPVRQNGPLAVQLAALNSHEAAQLEWSRLCRGHPALFSGRKPDVEQVDREGRTIYRLRTRGFASMTDANAFCEQARAQRVACTVAAF